MRSARVDHESVPIHSTSDFLQPARRVLVKQAGDERLYGNPSTTLLNRFEVLARQTDVQPSVFLERRLRVPREANSFAFAAGSGLPLASFVGLEQLVLVRVNRHGRTAHRVTASAFRLGLIVFTNTVCRSPMNGTRNTSSYR